MTLREIICMHAAEYPNMRPSDAVKLIYQNAYGCSHFCAGENAAYKRLTDECAGLGMVSGKLYEDIGGGYIRLFLPSSLPLTLVSRLFCLSAAAPKGTTDINESLGLLAELCDGGIFGFGLQELTEYIRKYKASGCPPVSHSIEYKSEYKAAYRVIKKEYAPLLELMAVIEKHVSKALYTNIAIDGRAASGKSTAAEILREVFNASLYHTDDYFLPPDKRSRERLECPGGNIDYERAYREIICGICGKAPFTYRKYSCHNGTYTEYRGERNSLNIVEGAYSMHPEFGEYYDLSVFFDIDPELQKKRIKQRDGEEYMHVFIDKWIPMEEKYIKAYEIDKTADITIKAEGDI